MARDNDRYVYYTIGIPKDDPELLNALNADAKKRGMTLEVPKLIVVRLADFYEGVGRPVSVERPEIPEEKQSEENADENAVAALEGWGL